MQLIEELRWRGLIHDMIPGTEEYLNENKAIGYVGFDPTASSLGIGNLVPVMMLVHFQRHGHHPIALLGGATGRVGDPCGKSEERTLLDEKTIAHNIERCRDQISHFLIFDGVDNPARIVNNYDWFKDFNLLDFLREVGKHLTVNYMMGKESVKKRMESGSGISFTEFSYQLIQGYDFYHLHKHENCALQFGGSDQWGNITAGTELIRRMMGSEEEVYAFTNPLITNSEGKKFGKSEKGNIFIDGELTSPYEFYQFFIQQSDDDIIKLTKIFSLKSIPELEALIAQNEGGTRVLQYALAEDMTERVHGKDALRTAIAASKLLFGKGGMEDLQALSEKEVNSVFKGVPTGESAVDDLENGVNIVDFLAETGAFKSKGEARRKVTKDRCVSINTEKVPDAERTISRDDIVNDHFILINTSKRNRHIVYVK